MGFLLRVPGSVVADLDRREPPLAHAQAGAFVLFAISIPLIVVSAILVLLLSRRSPFVAHLRIGQYGRPFWMWKLRTMWNPRDPPSAFSLVEFIHQSEIPSDKQVQDDRITSRFAAFCRRHSIDELPQLVHVLTGTMSLIGPRPLTADELNEHYADAAAEVLRVKPALTGLWQVRGRNRLTYRQRRRYDLFFVRKPTARLRRWILWQTLSAVWSGRDAA